MNINNLTVKEIVEKIKENKVIQETKKYLEELKKEYEYSKTLTIKQFDKRYIDEKEEWSDAILPSHRYHLEKFYFEGGELNPSKDCNRCDWHNDYVCFECEVEQVKPIC